MLLGRPGWDHLEGEELGGVKGEFCICVHTHVSTGSHPRAASLLAGGHTPLSPHQLPSRPPLCCWTPASPKSGCSRPMAGLRSGEPCSPLLEPPEAQPAPLRPPSLPNELLAHRAQGQGGQLGSQPASPGRASDEFQGLASCCEQAKTHRRRSC